MTAPLRVLVTGAGGPAAIAAMKSLRAEESVQLIAADMDPWAAGLYLTGERTLVPPGAAPEFTAVLLDRCRTLGVDVVLPTVDAELLPLARAREEFAAAGVALLLAPAAALDVILDKLTLAQHCAGVVAVPRTELFGPSVDPASWTYPAVVKPRRGSGSRGVIIVDSAAELAALDRSPSLIVQEFLPGEEYSVDVLADAAGHVIASVPRLRARVDSGVSVGGRTVHDPEVERFGRVVARATGVTYVANVQCRRDADGVPALLEVNPRMPGTLGLTIASGVDMPRLALAALLGQPVPAHVDFCDLAVVRFLDEHFLDPAEIAAVGMVTGMNFDEDYHVHSTFSDDGSSTLAENVSAAAERGLRTLCLADHVRRDTAWVPEFAAAVGEYRGRPELRVLAGVEAKIWDGSGRLDLPDALDGIDLVLIADHQFPADNGPVHPAEVRSAIAYGEMTAAEAIERVCEATARAVLYAGQCSGGRCRACCWLTCSACCRRSGSTRPWSPMPCWPTWPSGPRTRARWPR